MKRIGFALLVAAALFAPSAIAQNAAPPRPIAPGQSVSGELSLNDGQRRSGKYEDVYELQGRGGQRGCSSICARRTSIPIWW